MVCNQSQPYQNKEPDSRIIVIDLLIEEAKVSLKGREGSYFTKQIVGYTFTIKIGKQDEKVFVFHMSCWEMFISNGRSQY